MLKAETGVDIDELARPQDAIRVREKGFEFDTPCGGVDGVVDELECAGGRMIASRGGDCEWLLELVFADLRQQLLWQRECDLNRGGLKESDEGVVVCSGETAFFRSDVACAAGDWGEYFGVVEQEAGGLETCAFGALCSLRAFEGGAVGIDCGLGGICVGLSLVCLFTGRDALFEELEGAGSDCIDVLQVGKIAGDVGVGLLAESNVAGDVGFNFGDLTVNGFCVKLKEELALADILSFGEVDLDDGGSEACLDFDGGACFDGADGGNLKRDISGKGLDSAYGLGGVGRCRGGLAVAGEAQRCSKGEQGRFIT